jgi:hypothetical protein
MEIIPANKNFIRPISSPFVYICLNYVFDNALDLAPSRVRLPAPELLKNSSPVFLSGAPA